MHEFKQMKSWLIVFMILYSSVCFSQNKFAEKYGMGVVTFEFDEFDTDKKLFFYENIDDEDPLRIAEFSLDRQKDIEKYKEWLKIEDLLFDHGDYQFFCTEEDEQWYRLKVNFETGKSLWIKKTGKTQFYSWEQSLSGDLIIKRTDPQTNPIRKSPGKNSDIIEYDDEDCFKLLKVKGDWIQITPTGTEDCLALPEFKAGWIKWRDEEGFLIHYTKF